MRPRRVAIVFDLTPDMTVPIDRRDHGQSG